MVKLMSNHDIYKTSTYYYDLPERLIAQTPIEPRTASRLMLLDKNDGNILHKTFGNIKYRKSADNITTCCDVYKCICIRDETKIV